MRENIRSKYLAISVSAVPGSYFHKLLSLGYVRDPRDHQGWLEDKETAKVRKFFQSNIGLVIISRHNLELEFEQELEVRIYVRGPMPLSARFNRYKEVAVLISDAYPSS